MLGGAAEEASTPAAAAPVGDGLADGAARGEEEEVDVGIDLADDAEVDVEVEIQSLDRYVCSETAIFPFVAEGIRNQVAFAGLHH